MQQIITDLGQLKAVVDAYLEFEAFAYDTETMPGREPYYEGEDKLALDVHTNVVFWVSLAGPGRSDVIPIGHPLGERLEEGFKGVLAMADCPDPARCVRCSQGQKVNRDGSISRAKVTHDVPPRFGPPPAQLTAEEAWPVLKPLFHGPARKVGHNIRFDAQVVAKYLGGPAKGPFFDTQIAARLLNENHGSYRLGAVTERVLDYTYDKSLGKKGVENFGFSEAASYARQDALVSWLLYKRLDRSLRRENLTKVLDLENAVIEVVVDMELAGVPIDVEGMEKLDVSLRSTIADLQLTIEEFNGGPINLNKAADIRALVYEKRGRKVLATTAKTELPSTAAGHLAQHAFRDPKADDQFHPDNIKDKCVASILEFASVNKIWGTYVQNNLQVVRNTGRLYGKFNQMGTDTGRFTSDSPNLQNIPIRKGKEIRDLFWAGKGHKLIVNDYSQIELRELAHFTQDPLLIKAYTEGFDLHTATARNAYNIPAGSDPTPLQRSLAKNCNFSVVYGATAFTIETRYGVNKEEAEALVEAFYATYRNVAPWKAKVLRDARARAKSLKRDGRHVDPYVETLMGRRRRLPDLLLPDRPDIVPGRFDKNSGQPSTARSLRRAAERQAINSVIQGSAADLMKQAMADLQRRIREEDLPMEVIIQVHDEIVVRAPSSFAEEGALIVQQAMEGASTISVPVEAEGKVVDRWSEAK